MRVPICKDFAWERMKVKGTPVEFYPIEVEMDKWEWKVIIDFRRMYFKYKIR